MLHEMEFKASKIYIYTPLILPLALITTCKTVVYKTKILSVIGPYKNKTEITKGKYTDKVQTY